METVHTLLFVLQVLVAVALIGFILIQHGKGADAGAAFGSGSSSTVFGSQGSTSFLTKLTAILAFIFLANSLLLGYLATQSIQRTPTSLLDEPGVVQEQVIEQEIPVMPADEASSQDSDLPALPTQ